VSDADYVSATASRRYDDHNRLWHPLSYRLGCVRDPADVPF
jgi:hypothetical protein